MYNLNAIHIFVKVVDAEGFTAAAKLLNAPKSKISRTVSQLEEQLQTRLLERSTRHVRLTEAGSIFYQYCQRILAEAKQSENAIQAMSEKASGLLRISASLSMGQHLLGPVLADFIKQYPEIEIDLELNNRRVDLIEENFDVAIRIGELANSSLISKRIGSSHLQLYASKKFIKKNGEPQHPSDLKKFRVLGMSSALDKNQIRLVDDENNKHTVKMHFPIRANDFTTLLRLTKDDVGITIFPHFICESDSQLVRVLPKWQMPAAPIYLIYPSHRGATPKLRAFINFINESVSPKL